MRPEEVGVVVLILMVALRIGIRCKLEISAMRLSVRRRGEARKEPASIRCVYLASVLRLQT